jgi:hypothetical protein
MGSNRLTNVSAGTARTDAINLSQVQDNSLLWGGTSGGAANAQTLTLAPIITAYVAGQRYSFIAGFTNTAAATLNINGVGTKSIFNAATGAAIGAGEIVATRAYEVIYDGTQFLLLNDVTPIQNGDYIWLGTTGGTATVMTASATPAITAYKNGQKFRMTPNTASTGSVWTSHTLNVNGLGAIPIIEQDGQSPTVGSWLNGTGRTLELIYTAGFFVITSAAKYFTTYTSTLTPQNGTASGVTFSICKFMRIGNGVNLQVYVTWTQNTASAAYIDVSLPIRPSSANMGMNCSISTGAGLEIGFALIGSVVGSGVVRCYDKAQAQILTGAKNLIINGCYEIG